MKYKNAINYIYKHGQNILSYSFEQFIDEQFNEEVLYNAHPTVPNLLPPEWTSINRFRLRELNYWLGKRLIIWYEQTSDNRLCLVAEIGPMEYSSRLWLIEELEKTGLSFRENSKKEKARYTRFFSQKIDINKWNDMVELKQGMLELYNSPEFALLRKQIAIILNNGSSAEGEISKPLMKSSIDKKNIQIQNTFKKWMKLKNISENNYRISSRKVSFKIPLFDAFEEKVGETREKWWWHNGPFLFWMVINSDSIYFTLEVGPIEANDRVLLMEKIKEKGIKFGKKGTEPETKYTRIYSKTISIKGLEEPDLLSNLDSLYDNKELQSILKKLQLIYNEMIEDK